MRFRIAPLLGVVLVIALPLAAQDTQPARTAHAGQRQGMPRPTNLQVLPKNISGPELMAEMREYSKALGVECGFCHAQNPTTHHFDYALDTKPDKQIARTMIRMTKEVNSRYLSTIHDPDATPAQKTVTCGTCHRGNTMPAPFSPSAGNSSMSMPQKPE